MKLNIDEIENKTLSGLKDFQLKTVERIDYLFRNGQKRVLVADEVGMGKTLIAKGVIVKTARIRLEEQDDLFKVVYICSNQSIANQNVSKLKVTSSTKIEGVSDTRLSMQHLKITEQLNDMKLRDGFIQLIPLTPDTSFRMTSGGGNVNERALMFAILKRVPNLKEYIDELDNFLMFNAGKLRYDWEKTSYENRVIECSKQTNNSYPKNIINEIIAYNEEHKTIDLLISELSTQKSRNIKGSQQNVLSKLRVMFAEISIKMLQPDLVIMDEFQRFNFLISSDKESDVGILAHNFLDNDQTRVLLLSATPYKLYTTLDELDQSPIDEHYAEFFQITNFLFENRNQKFEKVWSDYSLSLQQMSMKDFTFIQAKKQAEDMLYEGMCRTERISVMDSGDYTDDSSTKQHLKISELDIRSYLEAGSLLKEIGLTHKVPLDYIKSSPYLLSFMNKYKLKEKIESHFNKYPEDIAKANKKHLWLKRNQINKYELLPKTNARLERLKLEIFKHQSEYYLWVPPTKPYYDMQGVYKNSKDFSKLLVFSSWEMVPRMIGTLVSYEAERKTIGKLYAQDKKLDSKSTQYFAKRRYPQPRLNFSETSPGEVRAMSLFSILYPSQTLANLYNPIECLNEELTLKQIEAKISKLISEKLSLLSSYQGESQRVDERWYYLAPMLMDDKEYVLNWLERLDSVINKEDNGSSTKGVKGIESHVNKLKDIFADLPLLGKKPADLVQTLVDMTLGSPAICSYRSNGHNVAIATELSRAMFSMFNSQESISTIDLVYGKKNDDNSYWQNVIKYCKDGCFQAMLDEYVHILSEQVDFSKENNAYEIVHQRILESVNIHSSSYDIDTFESFRDRVNGKKSSGIRMRTHFAVGFTKGNDESKSVNRKESVRNAFNSPFRPFVLATTSIGQEGLDFHHYCRKIMHWNLPSNPIDLEQREGRINRYKCLAIRQNVADIYGNIEFEHNVWNEMFTAALKHEKQSFQSDLVPFWCFGKNQQTKIERIVPMYPMSKDKQQYVRLIKILSLYRLTMGQARQEELLEHIFNEFDNPEELKDLFINLSPFSKELR